MKTYEKSYKGFVIWMAVFVLLLCSVVWLPVQNANLPTLTVLNLMSVGMAVLTWIIYKNERIYWYTGISFEEAKKAASAQRRRYALRHAKRFTWFAAAGLLYSAAAYWKNLPIGFSITVIGLGITAVAISTVKIQLE